MNIRLKLEVSEKLKIKLENSGLLIYVTNNTARAINENNVPLTPLVNNVGDRDSARIRELSVLHIACNKKKAEKFYYLTLLKNTLKNSVDDEKDKWNIVIKNIDQSKLKWGRDLYGNPYRYHLYLSDGDLLNEKNDLVINPTDIDTGDPLDPTNTANNLDKYKNQLFELDALLTNLETGFKDENKDDFDISLYTSLEDNINELQSYVNNLGPAKPGVDTKKTLYNIAESDSKTEQQPIKIKIDSWLDKLKEWRVWHQIIGLKTTEEVKVAKNVGFTIFGKADSAPTLGEATNNNYLDIDSLNVKEIKKYFPNPDGKYKGFLITNAGIQKKLFDFFRDEKFFGKVINGIDYSKETKPNKCRGFKPKDFTDNLGSTFASYGNHSESMNDKDGQVENGTDSFHYSKLVIDAWIAPNIDAAIDLLFFGITYENMIGKNGDRYANVNDPECLLYFNEIEESGITKSQILKGYYNALKHYKCGSKANKGKGDWTASNYYNDQTGAADGPRKKVEDNYLKIKGLIDYLDKDYKTYQVDKINELNEAKIKLFNYMSPTTRESDSAYKKIYKHWEEKIVDKVKEIDDRVSTLTGNPPNPDNHNFLKNELKVEIDKIESDKDTRIAMKSSMTSDEIHSLLEAIQIMRKFVEVKDATEKDATKLTQLTQLKTDKTLGWQIINKYKRADESGYADYRLKLYEDLKEKQKTLEEKQTEFLTKIWDEDFVDETTFKAKIDNADENVINATEKEKFKNEITPRINLANQLKSKGDEAKELISLLKYFRPNYSGENLKNKNKTPQLEKQLTDLKKYTEDGTSQNDMFTSLGEPEKEVVKNLIKEIQTKVSEMRKVQEEQLPKGPSSSDTPWTSLLIVAGIVLGLVGLIVYFGQRKKDSEESEELE